MSEMKIVFTRNMNFRKSPKARESFFYRASEKPQTVKREVGEYAIKHGYGHEAGTKPKTTETAKATA